MKIKWAIVVFLFSVSVAGAGERGEAYYKNLIASRVATSDKAALKYVNLGGRIWIKHPFQNYKWKGNTVEERSAQKKEIIRYLSSMEDKGFEVQLMPNLSEPWLFVRVE